MNLYITQIKAIDPADGEMKIWSGPNVPGITPTDAQEYCNANGIGYCEVVSEYIGDLHVDPEDTFVTLLQKFGELMLGFQQKKYN